MGEKDLLAAGFGNKELGRVIIGCEIDLWSSGGLYMLLQCPQNFTRVYDVTR